MEKIQVNVGKSYEVLIGRGLLNQAERLLAPFVAGRKILIVTDENVADKGYLMRLSAQLKPITESVFTYILPPGEAQKSMTNVVALVEFLADQNFSRQDIVVALGGGVIGDLVGFVASVYLRGIDFIQVPTTLLAAIDSSVGGKTGVDLPQGKNLVGAFHQPVVVLCDVDAFKTLLPNIFEDGCSEMIKYGMIMNADLLDEIFAMEKPLNAGSDNIVSLVKNCVEMKTEVVQQDERDSDIRQLLNYGHTLGHALEQVSGYQISHGRGVALGMSLLLKMATQKKYIHTDFTQKFDQLLGDYHLLPEKPAYNAEQLIKAMLRDKKRRSAEITIVLPVAYGKSELFAFQLAEFFEWFESEWENYEIHQ